LLQEIMYFDLRNTSSDQVYDNVQS